MSPFPVPSSFFRLPSRLLGNFSYRLNAKLSLSPSLGQLAVAPRWADFFGRKAPTTPGLAVLAMKTGAPVLPVFMVRDRFQAHRLIVKQPLELIHTGDIKKDVETNTQLFNHTLESMIREYPDQWFWVHRRWERKKKVTHR